MIRALIDNSSCLTEPSNEARPAGKWVELALIPGGKGCLVWEKYRLIWGVNCGAPGWKVWSWGRLPLGRQWGLWSLPFWLSTLHVLQICMPLVEGGHWGASSLSHLSVASQISVLLICFSRKRWKMRCSIIFHSGNSLKKEYFSYITGFLAKFYAHIMTWGLERL